MKMNRPQMTMFHVLGCNKVQFHPHTLYTLILVNKRIILNNNNWRRKKQAIWVAVSVICFKQCSLPLPRENKSSFFQNYYSTQQNVMPKHDNQNSEKSIQKVILNDLYHCTVINNICIAIK
uniref:Uncharacterized protein n=1 Tax=Anguilla anguilla TaxID=7936 RepID=A0A0E9X0Q1_ANGAN